MAHLTFREPPTKHITEQVVVLTELMDYPHKWAVVAESAPPGHINRWRDARRKVGGQGEFVIRQAQVGDAGLLDIFVKYVPEAQS